MPAEENKALVRRFVEEFWNQGNTAAADELMAGDAEIHMPTGEMLDLDELKGFNGGWRESFPRSRSWSRKETWRPSGGSHLGKLMGLPPTGRRVEAPGSVFYRIADGKIVEFRGQFDMMALMQQLGVISPPQQAEA